MNNPDRRPLRVAAAALVLLLAGCASTGTGYHYSQLVGKRYFKTNIDTYPVLILEVDGRSFVGGVPVLVDPGVRNVLLQGPPTMVDLQLTQTMKLDVKPCTRYYLVAVKQNPLQNEFTPRVDFEEPVPGCTPPPAK
ncbi:MAG: hypothetical protein M9915_01745 [Rhizobacter sp.]|nr:hypothetical protein [Burkholderiaceae bacterium]MCO5122456.1 hypothetical protein [Rhizobacter sp.]